MVKNMSNRLRGKIYTEDFSFKYGELVCSDGIIAEINILDSEKLSEVEKARLIIPGLVDVHMHGAVGVDVCTADAEALKRLVDYEKSCGVTTFLPTTMTLPIESIEEIVKTINAFMNDNGAESAIRGINLEGPFISKDKCGAQSAENIVDTFAQYQNAEGRRINGLSEMISYFQSVSSENIRLITIAPEKDGIDEEIRKSVSKDKKIHFSLGHSAATYDQAIGSFDAGANHVTHMYNAMSYVDHREPGIVGAAYDKKDVFVEIICDGNHLHPSLIRSTYDAFGDERIVLISDSTEATGCADGRYMLGDTPIVKRGNKAVLEENEAVLGGSVSNLYDCFRYAVDVVGIPLESAVRMVTYNPAKSVGLDDVAGILKVGRRADYVILDF